MSVTAVAAIAAGCTWNNPGADPYRGPVVDTVRAAVARYDMPAETRAKLVDKVRRLEPDTVITITKDGIDTPDGVAANLRDMHYGKGRVCPGPVIRDKWQDNDAQSAMVYCVETTCIAVPVICGNVSRIDYVPFPPDPEPPFRVPVLPLPPVLLVPEPSTLWLALVGLGAVLLRPWSKRR